MQNAPYLKAEGPNLDCFFWFTQRGSTLPYLTKTSNASIITPLYYLLTLFRPRAGSIFVQHLSQCS
jgi:hypothetical protein